MDRYKARGVSAQKEEVHAIFGQSGAGLFPQAFCKIVPDVLTGDADYCLAMHADGAGTKSSLAYLYYRETGDAGVFEGIAQDALVMNLDDLLCVGAVGPFILSNTIGRNARHVPGEVLKAIGTGFERTAELFRQWDMPIALCGGETADVGDLVGTVIVDATVVSRLRRDQVISNARVRPGDVIIGLSSSGQTTYESAYNSGIGSNGLTSARHDLLKAAYGSQYPESFDPNLSAALRYTGPYRLEDPLENSPVSVGQALLSPTRTYAPLVKMLLKEHRQLVTALVHCTGGGQTKCLRAGQGIQYIKNNLFDPPALFQAIKQASGSSWREMFQVFNMGHRFEIMGDERLLSIVKDMGQAFNLEVKQVGYCEASPQGQENWLCLSTPQGMERYSNAA